MFSIIIMQIVLIGFPLLTMVNKSLEYGVFPKLKLATIKPIPKVHATKKVEEFRSINMLPAIEKLLEIIVYRQVMKYIDDTNILVKEQSGFSKNHSCESALNFEINERKLKLDDNDTICTVFLDLKRAFKTIDRTILLEKLYHYGFRNIVFQWFESYLTNRLQVVKIQNSSSQPIINDMREPQADDTLIYYSCKDTVELFSAVNTKLENVDKRMRSNKLKLNTAKTKVMILGNDAKYEQIMQNNSNSIKTELAMLFQHGQEN